MAPSSRLQRALPASPTGGAVRLDLPIQAQPDDVTCGPTCLHAVYRYFGDDVSLERVIEEVEQLDTGGTLAVVLGCHALRRGYRARIHTANLTLFDPTWFDSPAVQVAERLRAQAVAKPADAKRRFATRGYLDFLELGGDLRYAEMEPSLLAGPLLRDIPVLTGLSATYLYRCARETVREGRTVYDDVAGEPTGHFVVLTGYDVLESRVWIADPLHENPGFGSARYAVPVGRVLASILLGALTYDANLLIVEPPADGDSPRTATGSGREPCPR